MDTRGQPMFQQRPYVETRLRLLVNADLKEICKAYNKPVSGTKATLQKRCEDILDEALRKGDSAAFDDLRYRANNRGKAQPRQSLSSSANTYSQSGGQYSVNSMAPGRPGTLPGSHRPPGSSRLSFKESPFYELLEVVVPTSELADGPEMPQNRNTVRTEITLSPEQCRKVNEEGNRLLMYCGISSGLSAYSSVDVAFPNQIEVRINEDDFKHNFKGLKNKPGTTKPADITEKVRTKPANYKNALSVTYALTTKRYAYTVYLARHISPVSLTEKIKSGNVISKQTVLAEMNKANADPDIEATSTRMTLQDPISFVRIALPVRGTVCQHNQCFDARMFLEMMEQAPQWNCPICSKTLSFQSLCVDKYFEDILTNTPQSVEQVDIQPNGEWRIIKEEKEEPKTNGTSRQARASYDDDFDDDLVEVPDPTNKRLQGLKRESLQPSAISPMTAFNTPPLSSREPSVTQSAASVHRSGDKRPQNVTIDLTLSSDEDEPPRPAKRQQIRPPAQAQVNSANSASSLHTPSSMVDASRQDQHFAHRQADNYRPNPPPGRSPGNLPALSAQSTNSESPNGNNFSQLNFAAGNGMPWSNSYPRPPSAQQTNGHQPFSFRSPPPRPSSSVHPGSAGGYKLPPINPPQSPNTAQHPQPQQIDSFGNSFGQWRGDFRGSSYSGSPG